MPRLHGWQEKRHQPFWDTLCRADNTTAPNPTVGSTTKLFAAGTNLSQPQWTNMPTSGSLASDQVLVVFAIRCWMWFNGTSAAAGFAWTSVQLYLNFYAGDKSMFHCPAWYAPAGGGPWGLDSATPIINNGDPTPQSILKMARPVVLNPRQNFYVDCTFYDFTTTSARTTYINASNVGAREIKVILDGLHTRDVQ